MNIEELKSLNLVEFLNEHYGLEFKKSGQAYVCRSPFGADQKPSFFVRLVGSHWLFKDFSSGFGGSIIDFIQRIDNLSDIASAMRQIEKFIGSAFSHCNESQSPSHAIDCSKDAHMYDVEALYKQFKREAPEVCRQYLLDRGINQELVDELITNGEVVHNLYKGRSYCCFAVRDSCGVLNCLDNHEIGGGGKFVLGTKTVFTRDWATLQEASEVFVCEGIIDYLSIKTLEQRALPGLALLGNQLSFDTALLSQSERVIAALDDDRGGSSALYDLIEQYPDKEIKVYDLQGKKDPNELLQAISKEPRRLTDKEKLELYEQFQQADNKAELARQWKIDRSHMYQIVKDCQQLLLSSLSGQRPGRRPVGQPSSMQEAWQQIKQMQEEIKQLSIEHDKLKCRDELLGIRLKWAEIEAAELRNGSVDEKTGQKRKTQIKKKKKKRRLR